MSCFDTAIHAVFRMNLLHLLLRLFLCGYTYLLCSRLRLCNAGWVFQRHACFSSNASRYEKITIFDQYLAVSRKSLEILWNTNI